MGGDLMINNEDLAKVVHQKCDYYIPKFEEIIKNKDKESWNYAGFFFSFIWLVYRKMYVLGFSIVAIKILVMFIGNFEGIVSILTHFICGIYGNCFYLKHCEKKVNDNINLDENIKSNKLYRAGGVSIAGLIVVFITVFISTGIYLKYNPAPF
jgi:uncharacterized membrane protein